MKRQYRLASVALFSLAVLATTGCNARVAQCNKLIKVANAATSEVKALNRAGKLSKNKMGAMSQMSAGLDRSARKVKEVNLEDETLQGFQKRLQTMYEKTGRISRQIISAATARDMKRATSLLKEMASESKTESQIVNDINQYCRGGLPGK